MNLFNPVAECSEHLESCSGSEVVLLPPSRRRPVPLRGPRRHALEIDIVHAARGLRTRATMCHNDGERSTTARSHGFHQAVP